MRRCSVVLLGCLFLNVSYVECGLHALIESGDGLCWIVVDVCGQLGVLRPSGKASEGLDFD